MIAQYDILRLGGGTVAALTGPLGAADGGGGGTLIDADYAGPKFVLYMEGDLRAADHWNHLPVRTRCDRVEET